MATLHKFKLLQCAVAGSPTRSPTASPVIHIRRRRRRKTLRMLLSRPDHRRFPLQEAPEDLQEEEDDPPPQNCEREARVRRKLKDLFVSSPPLEDKVLDKRREEQVEFLPATSVASGISIGSSTRRSLRPISATFRLRLLRRAWRPVLVTIPE